MSLNYLLFSLIGMDTFRKEQKELSEATIERISEIKETAKSLYDAIVASGGGTESNSRELSIAKTKLEEVVMWAVKHWTA